MKANTKQELYYARKLSAKDLNNYLDDYRRYLDLHETDFGSVMSEQQTIEHRTRRKFITILESNIYADLMGIRIPSDILEQEMGREILTPDRREKNYD